MKAIKKEQRYVILSPNGFSIHNKIGSILRSEVLKTFSNWKKNFESQGYYSGNRGNINLHDLDDHCQVTKVDY
tara:strand:- start:763 stop:981 length:219 start_codon:yes stop_codon:yes gene_type:complete